MKEHELVEKPLGSLLTKFAIPCILALLVSSLYNIVDQIFIGHGVGYLGNGATNVVFPITIIALGLALFIGDGCAAFYSLSLGRKEDETAEKALGSAVLLTIIISLVLVVIFVLGKSTILNAFGATEANRVFASDYFNMIVIGIPFFMFANTLNSIIRADGNPQYAMMSMVVGAIINVILDAIMIFALGWGVTGAGLATTLGQIVSAIISAVYLTHTNGVKLRLGSFNLNKTIGQFLPLGISSLLTQVAIVVTMGVMNSSLVRYGAQSIYGSDIPLTTMGIVMKVFQIVISIAVGVAAGAQPIVGYNMGAGRIDRVKKLYQMVVKIEVVIGLVGMVCFEVFPTQILNLFGTENALYEQFGALSFRVFLATIILCVVQKSTAIFLQSLGKPVMSMMLSLLRDFVLMVSLIIICSRIWGVTGALYSAPIADVISFVVTIIFMTITFKQLDRIEQSQVVTSKA